MVLRRGYPLLMVLVASAVSLGVYDRLPATMAVHWDLDGNPDGWMPRGVGAFLTPVAMLLVAGILRTVGRRRVAMTRPTLGQEIGIAAILGLLLAVHLVVLAVALGYRVPLGRVVPGMIGALFVLFGGVLPLARANASFGVRTPWTLSSESVWRRTHEFAGVTLTAAGAAMIVSAILLPKELTLAVAVAGIVAGLVGPAVYSYLTWKRETKR